MDENDQPATPIPTDHLEVLLDEPLPSPTLDEIESVTSSLREVPTRHDGIQNNEDPIISETAAEASSSQNRYDQGPHPTPLLTCTTDTYFRQPQPSASTALVPVKHAKMSHCEDSISILGVDVNTVLIARAALSQNIRVFIYDHDIRFHKDLIGAKFVDTPAALAQHAKVVFICLADPTAKHEQCTGKFGLFTRTTKDSSVVDVTATSEYYATLFSQSCRDHKVHLINTNK